MEDNENEEVEPPVIVVRPNGVSSEVFLLIVLAMSVMIVFLSWQLTPHKQTDSCVASESMQKVQLQAQAAQVKANEDQQKQAFALGAKVAQLCYDKGWVPQFSGFNVTCTK